MRSWLCAVTFALGVGAAAPARADPICVLVTLSDGSPLGLCVPYGTVVCVSVGPVGVVPVVVTVCVPRPA
jgi:hypothetical protein